MKSLLNSILGKNNESTKKVIPLEEIIFNVNNFNIWFNHKDNGAEYAHSGIFLRVDKLSESHITDYLLKCYGIENPAFLFSKPANEMISEFQKEIRKDWLNKLNDESKWNTIPSECEYDGKVYRILNIDMQGGYFTLQDLNAKKGDIQVIDNIDMDKCNLIK
jgi:hypothetical protein